DYARRSLHNRRSPKDTSMFAATARARHRPPGRSTELHDGKAALVPRVVRGRPDREKGRGCMDVKERVGWGSHDDGLPSDEYWSLPSTNRTSLALPFA